MSKEQSTAIVRAGSQLPATNMADFVEIGKLLAQTGMFGTQNPAEGFVIAAMCHQSGLTYIEFMQQYHVIKGKVSKKADAILADFNRTGGEHKIVKRDGEGAVIEFKKGVNTYTSACLWSDCQNEPFVYEGKESEVLANLLDEKKHAALKLKPKWATPRSRMQMLFARAVSDGVRAVDPCSVQGQYTPEEVEDFDVPGAPSTPVKLDKAEMAKRVEVVGSTLATSPEQSTAQEDKPVTQPQQQAVSTATEETPFDLVNKTTENADYSTCPVAGNLFGVKWAEMTVDVLKVAENLSNPEMTAGHREAVRKAMWSKTQKEGAQ